VAGANPASRPDEGDSPVAARGGDLALRVISACVLVPLALAVTYFGGLPFIVFWGVAAIAILWEWSHLAFRDLNARLLLPGGVGLVGATALAAWGRPGSALLLVVMAAALAGGIAANGRRLWAAGGVVYAGAAFIGPVLLRHDAEFGLLALVFLFAVVWATDIFAYFAGRAFGGPRLWPTVSPNKTWSGALAGTIGGIAAGAGTAYAGHIAALWPILAAALVLSVLSQVGDLVESAIKRRFAAKDTSGLIPGHGGVMDRLDGFLVAAFAAALIGLVRQGVDAPARGLLIW
jgi:phosphatidate cytidylyltransferase